MLKRNKIKRQKIKKRTKTKNSGLSKLSKRSFGFRSKYDSKDVRRTNSKETVKNYKKSKKKIKKRNSGFKSIFQLKIFKISFFFIFVVILITSISVYIGKDNFKIDSVTVSGIKYIDPSFESNIKSEYTGKFFFFVFPSKVTKELKSKTGYISDISVTKTLPRSLNIEIEEREPFFALINRKGVYIVSRDGYILEKTTDLESPELTKENYNYITDNISLENVKLENDLEEVLEKNVKILEDNRIIQEEINNAVEADPNKLMIVNQKPLTEEEVVELEKGIEELKNQIRLEKLAIIEVKKKEIYNVMDSFWSKEITELGIENYIKIFSYHDEVLTMSAKVEENIDGVFAVATDLSKIAYLGNLDKLIFISDLQTRLIFASGKEVVVNPKDIQDKEKLSKDISLVIDDLVKKAENFSVIDARGDKIAVKNN